MPRVCSGCSRAARGTSCPGTYFCRASAELVMLNPSGGRITFGGTSTRPLDLTYREKWKSIQPALLSSKSKTYTLKLSLHNSPYIISNKKTTMIHDVGRLSSSANKIKHRKNHWYHRWATMCRRAIWLRRFSCRPSNNTLYLHYVVPKYANAWEW